MKILFSEQIREADAYTIDNIPIPSVDLMEKASEQLAVWIDQNISSEDKMMIFCGPGNNGGDGLALARLLSENGYMVEVFLITSRNKLKGDPLVNFNRLKKYNDVKVGFIEDGKNLPLIQKNDVVIDALFGSGLTRPLDGLALNTVNHINKSGAKVISVDIPSGLFGEDNSSNNLNNVIKSDYTLSFQFPKLSFFLPESGPKTGKWFILPIGLHPDFIKEVKVKHYFLNNVFVKELIKPRRKFSHKGHYGHALLMAGSYGMMGASVLASRSCLKTGIGLLTSHVPKAGYQIMQTAVPEVMVSVDQSEHLLSSYPDINSYSAVGIGPGIGQSIPTINLLEEILNNIKVPLVIDADGLNILGKKRELLNKLPENSVLTPHPKEFERIAGKSSDDYSRYQLLQEFALKYKLIVILKGAYTAIADSDGSIYFNTTGNPGMATAGSGDVLTGMILSLLAQRYKPIKAAYLGVYLHGLSGDLYARDNSEESLTASDLIDNVGAAIKNLKQKN